MAKGSATIYDVADLACVSIATVSRVLNGGPHVRPETRERVEAAIRQLRFVPSTAARSLSGGKKWAIGLAYPLYEDRETFSQSPEEDSYLLYSDAVVRGASSRAAQLGYSLFACAVRLGHAADMMPLERLSSSVDGIILADRVVDDVGAMRITKRMRTVHLSGSGKVKFGATLRVDNEGGIRALVHHLATDHAVRDFGFIGGVASSPDAVARYDAFASAVKAVGGVMRDENILVGDFEMARAEAEVARRVAARQRLPEVFVAANDQMALGAIRALQAAGRRIPDDVMVTGFDDLPLARASSPDLTTVAQPSFELGVTAVNLVVGLLSGEVDKGSLVTLPTNLVVRSSCGCAPGSAAVVSSASLLLDAV